MKRPILISLLIVSLLAGFGIASIISPYSTITETVTANATTPSTTTSTTKSDSNESVQRLYELEFIQKGQCSPQVWLAPWAVVLDNQTIVQPSNATLPSLGSGAVYSHAFENDSTITFSVPDGTYNYELFPQQGGFGGNGSVTIDDSDASVQIYAPVVPCANIPASTG
jgi:hypothetical protein